MLPDRKDMVEVLAHAHAFQKLRQKLAQKAELAELFHAARRIFGFQDFYELVADSFFGDEFKLARKLFDGGLGFGLNLKAELGGKAHGAHQSQSVFTKALLRLPDGPDYFLLQIRLAAEKVNDLEVRLHWEVGLPQGHRINCKIPPLQIVLQIFREAHLVGMALVRILLFQAVGRDFNHFQTLIVRIRLYSHRAVFVFVKTVRENFLDFFRSRVRGRVPVFRFCAQEKIPHAYAHQIRLKTGGAKLPDYFENFFGNFFHAYKRLL